MRVEPVSLGQIVDLRHRILRQGLPREAAIFEGDDAPEAIHLGAFVDGALVGCVTLHASRWDGQPAWQLRGMAVDENQQRTGVGRELLKRVHVEVAARTPDWRLWCNARVPAARFYEKMGWMIVSEVFDIPTAGPHVKMVGPLIAE